MPFGASYQSRRRTTTVSKPLPTARLTELANAWRTAQATREFIVAPKEWPATAQEPIAGRTPDEWLTWAEERLRTSDPLA